jgi:hypothetical protein
MTGLPRDLKNFESLSPKRPVWSMPERDSGLKTGRFFRSLSADAKSDFIQKFNPPF